MKKLIFQLLSLTALIIGIMGVHGFLSAGSRIPAKIFPTLLAGDYTWTLIAPMSIFALTIFGLCLLLVANAVVCGKALGPYVPESSQLPDAVGILQFILSWGLIILANSWVAPRSLYAFDVSGFALWSVILVALGGLLFLAIELFACVHYLRYWLLRADKKISLAFGLVLALSVLAFYPVSMPERVTDGKRPNIIVVSVDSLRNDVLDHAEWRKYVPTIDEFMTNSVRFDTVVTPLARTYPSWISTLSGKFPRQSGARANLLDPALVETNRLLTHDLQQLGYTTVFATDERRFSNIDESYGFDEIVGPGYGAADFAIGVFADLPIINVFAASWFGEWLFPYIRDNRAVPHTYYPEQFSRRLETFIRDKEWVSPVFLVAHFCLPHWPYHWADSPTYRDVNWEEKNFRKYMSSLVAADQQVKSFLDAVSEVGLTDNSIVLLKSDHGEGFRQDIPFRAQGSLKRDPTDHRLHGTNIFSDAQHKVVLGFQDRRIENAKPGVRDQPASTVDLRPTLLDLIGHESALTDLGDIPGKSLAPWIEDGGKASEPRIFELETGFILEALTGAGMDIEALLEEAVPFYGISSDGRLEILGESFQDIMRSKSLGVTDGKRVVGSVPVYDGTRRWYVADWDERTISDLDSKSCDHSCRMLGQEVVRRFELEPWPVSDGMRVDRNRDSHARQFPRSPGSGNTAGMTH